jgi:5-hydroxyisourate hydrolase
VSNSRVHPKPGVEFRIMRGITTHVLDTSVGLPARGIPVVLERQSDSGGWVELARDATDESGRASHLLDPGAALERGTYRLTIEMREYFHGRGEKCFYPMIAVIFTVDHPEQHYHLPILVSPFGFSTYRGS